MSSSSCSFAATVASIALLVGGCATDLVERRLGFVSMGMSRTQVARLLGDPRRTSMTFDPAGYFVRIKNGKMESVGKRPEGSTGPWNGISPPALAALNLVVGASTGDVVAALGQSSSECSWYWVNRQFDYEVCFEHGRVSSKRIFDRPVV